MSLKRSLGETVKQTNLSDDIFDAIVAVNAQDGDNFVRHIEIVAGFLASIGGSQEDTLFHFATETLKQSKDIWKRMIPDNIATRVQLQHVFDLLTRFSGQLADPFDRIRPKYRAKMTETRRKEFIERLVPITRELGQILDIWRAFMIEYFVEDTYNADSPIIDSLQYREGWKQDWCIYFEDIPVAYGVSAFEAASEQLNH